MYHVRERRDGSTAAQQRLRPLGASRYRALRKTNHWPCAARHARTPAFCPCKPALINRAPLAPRPQERQRLQRCLQHTLNNLLQARAFDAAALNAAADALGGHAQRSRLPLLAAGDWDANTLLAVLTPLSLEVIWHDARDARLQQLDLHQPGLLGLVLNIRAPASWLSWITGSGRHWLALRKLGGAW